MTKSFSPLNLWISRSAALFVLLAFISITSTVVAQKPAPGDKVKQKDFSFGKSVSVKWRKGKADVVFTQQVGSKKKSRKHSVENLDALRTIDFEAWQLIQDYQSAGQTGQTPAMKTPQMKLRALPEANSSSNASPLFSSGPSSRTPSNNGGAFSSWQVSGMTNNNGQIRRFNDSGSSSTGTVGRQAMPEAMKQQLRQMINQSNDPTMKAMLQNMLNQQQGDAGNR